MGRISRGWKLTKLSLRVIRKDKEILLLPVLSAAITLLVLASFIVGIFVSTGFEGGATLAWFVMACALPI